MTFDDQFRPAIDNLAARLRRDVELHLDTAVEELTARAETLAAEAEVQRATAIEHASRTAWMEAEKATTERLLAKWAETERTNAERQATEFAEAERAGIQRLAAERAEVERVTIERLAVERAEAELVTMERLSAERAEAESVAAQRMESVRAGAERTVAERIATQKAALEQAMAERVAAARDDARAEATRVTSDRLAAERAEADRETAARHAADRAVWEAQVRFAHQSAELAAGTRLVNAFRSIDAGQSLSDIMTTLIDAASDNAARVALFLAAGLQVKSWRFHGFEPPFTGDDSLTLSVPEAGIIADAIESRAAIAGGGDCFAPAPAFADLPLNRRAVAVPILVNDEVVGVVYADQGASGEVGLASWASTIEILTRHASRALEALTAHRLATTLGSGATRPRNIPPAVVHTPAQWPAPEAASGSPAPDAHTAAQHYAHVLVSKIRMAHEPDVQAGGRERDLMTRLGGHIARAWALYEAKVPEAIRANTNYFHAELVRTLADGDASLLSPQP